MSGITLASAQAQLEAYMAAEVAVLNGQSYSIAGRSLNRANLADIQKGVATWNAKVIELSGKAANRRRSRTVVVAF